MKATITRILGMLLCLALTFGLCVGAVQATAAQEVAPAIHVNSIYGNSIEDKPMLGAAGSSEENAKLGAPSKFHTSLEELYKEARQLAVARNTYFEVGLKTTEYMHDTISNSIANCFSVHTGNPKEGDYLDWNGFTCEVGGEVESSNGYYYYTMWVKASYYTTAAQEREVDAAVKSLLDNLGVRFASDYQKVKAVYDYLATNIVYDQAGFVSNDIYCHTTHSAIIAKNTVCQGYASLFYRLMMEMGVNARLVAGDASYYSTPYDASDDHGWNIVKLNGKWYNLDATWDAELHPNGRDYEYFLRCDANFPEHTPWSQYTTSEFQNAYRKSTSDFNPAYDSTTSAENGWVQQSSNWYYYKNYAMTTGWKQIDGAWYYFGGNGAMLTGWLEYGAKWYYFNSSGAMVTKNTTIDGKLQKFNSEGVWLGEDTSAKSGWSLEGGAWYYYKSGSKATGWQTIDGKWYFFASNGAMKTGWLQQGSSWYYLNASGAMVTGTVTIDGKQHKFNSSGIWQGEVQNAKNGWAQEGGIWYYYQNGAKATGWKQISGKWYFFASNGAMKTGWLQQGSKWYYFNASGVMVTGTVTIDGKQNKFDANGVWQGEVQQQKNGWYKEGSLWFYYQNGAKATGWKQISGKWYYFASNGAMTTGWLQVGANWYYFDANGIMATGTVTISGKQHKFDANGVWQGEVQTQQNGWVQQNGKWYYYENGTKATSWKNIGDYTYYFGSDGVMRTGWVQSLGDWYYMDQNGAMQMYWQDIGGKTYYFDHYTGAMWHDIWAIDAEARAAYFCSSDGYIYKNGYYTIDGVRHYFDANGKCTNPPDRVVDYFD